MELKFGKFLAPRRRFRPPSSPAFRTHRRPAVLSSPALVSTPPPSPALVSTPPPSLAASTTPPPSPAVVSTPRPFPAAVATPPPSPAATAVSTHGRHTTTTTNPTASSLSFLVAWPSTASPLVSTHGRHNTTTTNPTTASLSFLVARPSTASPLVSTHGRHTTTTTNPTASSSSFLVAGPSTVSPLVSTHGRHTTTTTNPTASSSSFLVARPSTVSSRAPLSPHLPVSSTTNTTLTSFQSLRHSPQLDHRGRGRGRVRESSMPRDVPRRTIPLMPVLITNRGEETLVVGASFNIGKFRGRPLVRFSVPPGETEVLDLDELREGCKERLRAKNAAANRPMPPCWPQMRVQMRFPNQRGWTWVSQGILIGAGCQEIVVTKLQGKAIINCG